MKGAHGCSALRLVLKTNARPLVEHPNVSEVNCLWRALVCCVDCAPPRACRPFHISLPTCTPPAQVDPWFRHRRGQFVLQNLRFTVEPCSKVTYFNATAGQCQPYSGGYYCSALPCSWHGDADQDTAPLPCGVLGAALHFCPGDGTRRTVRPGFYATPEDGNELKSGEATCPTGAYCLGGAAEHEDAGKAIPCPAGLESARVRRTLRRYRQPSRPPPLLPARLPAGCAGRRRQPCRVAFV